MEETDEEKQLPRMRLLNYPPARIEVDVSLEVLARMMKRVESCFSNVRYSSPFRDDDTAAFAQQGLEQVDLLQRFCARAGVSLNGLQSCLELGCGHGRATIALSGIFPKVIAVDISKPHLEAAQVNASRLGCRNIEFVHNESVSSLRKLPFVDLFYSRFVLQHNPPPIIKFMLDTMLSKINPGGLGYFQIATYALGYSFEAESYLATSVVFEIPEMHMLPQTDLFALLEQHRCSILEIREEGSAGRHAVSFHILVRKRADPAKLVLSARN